MSTAVAVALGGACGALLRWLAVEQILRWFGPGFPFGTMAVNLVGSLLLGLLVSLLAEGLELAAELRAFLMVGFLGGFTTFSAYSWDAVTLAGRGEWWQAAGYALGSVAFGVAGFLAGARLARALL